MDATPASRAAAAGSPLDQLLQVSQFPSQPSGFMPLATTAAHIAGGRSAAPAASAQCKSGNQLVADAPEAGARIHTSESGNGRVQITTMTQGATQVAYSHDLQSGTVTVNGSFTDAKGRRQEVHASQDSHGVVSRTVYEKGRPVVQRIDMRAHTRTEAAVDAKGRRIETTTDLTSVPVKRRVKAGDSFMSIAREQHLDPKQLQALNPDLKGPKDFRVGRELVVAGPRTTVTQFNGDGSVLRAATGTDGSAHVTFEAASGRRTTLQGPKGAEEKRRQAVQADIFRNGKTLEQAAGRSGMTLDEVMSCLGKGTVDVQPASADSGDVEIRRLYDPASNTLVIESHDYQHDTVRREVIDNKQVFHVRQVDLRTGKYVAASMRGGAGYVQQQADRQQGLVKGLDRQISELDVARRMAVKTGEPVPELLARRKELVAHRDVARLDLDVQQGKATSVLLAGQQQEMEVLAAQAVDAVATAAPGSARHRAAVALQDEVLGQLDRLDRTRDFAAADVVLLQATRGRHLAEAAQQQAEQQLEARYQTWKRDVWTWGGMSEEQIRHHEEQGESPLGHPRYRNAQEEDKAAREDFERYQQWMAGGSGSASASDEVHGAWRVRNQARDAALQSKVAFNDASIAQQDAELKLTQGDVARLKEKKNAWMQAHPDAFPETFALQAGLDKAQARVADLSVGTLLAGEERKHDLYLLSLSAEQRHSALKLQEAEQHYQEDNKIAHAELAARMDRIQQAGMDAKVAAVDEFIGHWNQAHPDLKAQLDRLDAAPFTSVRAAEHRDEERERLLESTPEFRNLKAALDVRAQAGAELSRRAGEDVEHISQDLAQIEKGMEGHSWVRDGWSAMFGDASEDAKAYTQEQLGQAKTLRDDLAAGRISQSDFVRREGALRAGYGIESLRQAGKVEDSDQTWGVVDEAVRATAIMAAGIGTTLATGGNVVAGFAVATAVAEGWDGAGDVVAMAQGRDIHADGHSSMLGLEAKVISGDASWDDVRSTLKDEVIDVATNAVSAGALGAGARTTAALMGGRSSLSLGQRALIGARSGFVSQGVDGAGRVGVETLRAGLDGKLGTAEGDARIQATLVQSAAGLVTAPVTGLVSGALPLRARVPGAAFSAQFVNDGVGSVGTMQIATLANEGRGMNRAEFIATSVQSVSGTMLNVAMHAGSRAIRSGEAPAPEAAPHVQDERLGPLDAATGSDWHRDVLREAALHPAVQAELPHVVREFALDAEPQQVNESVQLLFGDAERVNLTARHFPETLDTMIRRAITRLEQRGERADIRGWTPVTTPHSHLMQIRPMLPPRFETVADFVRVLDGATPQAKRIARALEDERIKLHVLDQAEFRAARTRGDRDDLPLAFARGAEVFLRRDDRANWSQMLSLVHEGTHALDHLSQLDVEQPFDVRVNGTVIHRGVHAQGGPVFPGDLEARAYYYQIEYAQALGLYSDPHGVLGAPVRSDQINGVHTMDDAHRHIGHAYPDAGRLFLRPGPDPDNPPVHYERPLRSQAEPPPTSHIDALLENLELPGPARLRDASPEDASRVGPGPRVVRDRHWDSDLSAEDLVHLREQWWREGSGLEYELSRRDPLYAELARRVRLDHRLRPYPIDALHETGPLMEPLLKRHYLGAAKGLLKPEVWFSKSAHDRPGIVVGRIELLRNENLLDRFVQARADVQGRSGDANVQLLYSGHGPEATEYLAFHGHDPVYRDHHFFKGYGAHGSGIYLTDSVDKAVSYARLDQEPGEERAILAQAVVLGRTHEYTRRGANRHCHNNEMARPDRHPDNKLRPSGEGRDAPREARFDEFDSLKSVPTAPPGAGLLGTMRYRKAFDSVEYLVRNADQVYPVAKIHFRVLPDA